MGNKHKREYSLVGLESDFNNLVNFYRTQKDAVYLYAAVSLLKLDAEATEKKVRDYVTRSVGEDPKKRFTYEELMQIARSGPKEAGSQHRL